MKHLLFVLSATLLAAPQQEPVGTFHAQSLVLAYYRSPQWKATLKEKLASMPREEAEKWGPESQELAHRQLMGKAPVDNILAALAADLPALAAKAGVKTITEKPPKGAPTVDVTELLLTHLKADERTRKIIEDMRRK